MEVLTKLKDINSAGFGDIDMDYPGVMKMKGKKKQNILFNHSNKNRNIRTEALSSNKRYKREDISENIDHIDISTQLNNTSASVLNGPRNAKGLSVGPGSLNRT
jgi:hypothetical protein